MDSGASDEDLEDFQAGSAFCRAAITFLHVAASVSGGRSHFSASETKFKTILWQELGLLVLVVLVAILTYSSLVYFIQTTQYIFMVFLISNFSLKSSYLLLLSSSHSSISHPFPSIFPLQVYFAERESQISLGDLNARNCTGWVEGLNKQNVVAAFNNQTISMVGAQTTAGGSGERT